MLHVRAMVKRCVGLYGVCLCARKIKMISKIRPVNPTVVISKILPGKLYLTKAF